ncbi:MAG: ExbD/TolR family protein [Gemmataceae bacterium]
MADKRRFLDVWIVETNTVYQEVPYEVVTDWLQQGRLLDDDRVKPSGTPNWMRVGDTPELRPYSLTPQEEAPQDAAEALEPMDTDHAHVPHRRHAEEEDDDVDMIPLIDVTLVLLIFFMMTATTAGAAAMVATPRAETGQVADDPNGVRIDIRPDDDGKPLYSVAEGNNPAGEDDRELTSLSALLGRLKVYLDRRRTPATLTINAHKDLKAVIARDLILGLRAEPYRSKLSSNFFGVSEKEP